MCTIAHMNTKVHGLKTLLTTREVAGKLSLSISQVARYAARAGVRKLPGATGHYLFDESDVERIRKLRDESRGISGEAS